MRMTVNIPDEDIGALDALAKTAKASREELILKAVSSLLRPGTKPIPRHAFGAWGNSEVDGLTYERELRDEW